MRQASKLRQRVTVAIVMAVLAGGSALAAVHLENNFHAVVDGEAYRSAQPTPDRIRSYSAKYHIATIINLRGTASGQAWYDAEISTAKALGISHIDFGISGNEVLSQQKSVELIELMRSAPKPVLIHCKAGSDRTGLAAALYLAAVARLPEERSERELSLRYGHFPIPWIGTYAMDKTFEMMEPLLGFSDS